MPGAIDSLGSGFENIFTDPAGGIDPLGGITGGGFDVKGKGASRESQLALQGSQRELAELQALIAQTLFQDTQGIRDASIQGLEGFLETGELPESLQVPFGSVRSDIASQGSRVREDIIGRSGARGGQLTDALISQRINEAGEQGRVGLLELPTRERLFNQAVSVGTGAPSQAVPAASAASAGFANVSNQIGGQQAAQQQALGEIAALAAKFILLA
ncbi:MAG: hypothetical protein ACR2QC_11860 [Gammaproteobacteria bacterium]